MNEYNMILNMFDIVKKNVVQNIALKYSIVVREKGNCN